MKLSKQERIATIVILILVILGVGIFVFIKPAFDGLASTNKNLENKQAEYNAIVEKQSRKATLRTQIEDTYKEGEHMADMFFPELTSYQADEAMRAFLEDCRKKVNIVVEELSVEEPATSTLSPYFYVSNEVSYELKSYATQGVDAGEKETKRLERLTKLQDALGGAQTIGSSTVTFKVSTIDRDDLLKFADAVNNYIVKENNTNTRKAIILNGMSFSCPEVEKEYDSKVDSINKEAEKAGRLALEKEAGTTTQAPTTATPENPEGTSGEKGEVALSDTLFSVDTSITFFSIERMQNPTEQLDRQDGVIA